MPASAKKRLQLNSDQLHSRLKLRSQISETKLRKKHPIADQFFNSVGLSPGRIRHHATNLLASGALAGTLLLSTPRAIGQQSPNVGNVGGQTVTVTASETLQHELAKRYKTILPPAGNWRLTEGQEQKLSDETKNTFGVDARAQLDGNHLPNVYGRMGAEQHLPRYPGDSVYDHGDFLDKGATPGLGAWGYFSNSKEQLTGDMIDEEKYYVAVPTLYLPDWDTKQPYLKDWYKYRRVLVVNPDNGKSIVCDIADSGPSWWTGKQFGGSPEVLAYLGIDYGMQNHPVVMLFLNDPNNEIPLGPLEYNIEKHKAEMTFKS